MTSIQDLAQQWLAIDQNEKTRAEIQGLVDKNDTLELEKRLRKRIVFGTAGLRGTMQAGFSYMNDVTVSQTSTGLGHYLLSQFGSSTCASRGIVVGHDHRHNSERFACLTAAAFIKLGIKVYFYDELVHTPMVPFGIGQFEAVAGVMVTASHNPAADNGYKVYWGNGCQIIPPHDSGIFKAIEENKDHICWDTSLVDSSPLVEKRLSEVKDAYFKAVGSIADSSSMATSAKGGFKFVYTPMHGVGLPAMKRVVEDLGLLESMVIVEEQAQPDPIFPTVKFPNPEEKGALNLAISYATAHSIPLVLASDPDADRFAAAISTQSPPNPTSWRILTGNELGILFASHILTTYPANKPKSKLAMLASTVSSQMLSTMAHHEGFHYEETLTGFKWLGNIAQDLSSAGYDALFAFEEAIGYMFSPVVYDKDGIAAAAVFLTMAMAWKKEENLNPLEKLEALFRKYGYFESCNGYFISPSPGTTAKVFSEIRALAPKMLGKRNITRWRDLTVGVDSCEADGIPKLPVSKNSEMITCELEGGEVRFSVRGSGTEPKIKMYIECKASTREQARQDAQEVFGDLEREWFRLGETGLRRPEV